MKKLLLISAFILFTISSSFAYQSTVTCSVVYYGGGPNDIGASSYQTVTVQQNCDVALEAGTSTIGYAVAQLGSYYAYADPNIYYDNEIVTSVSAGSTIYLTAVVTANNSGWSYARVSFGYWPNLH